MPITCTIIAHNEADRILQAIESVRDLVDEVLVIDSGSSDETIAIATAAGARVIYNPWPGFGPQKRFAEDNAKNDWILNLDADEWLADDLRQEIQKLFESPPPSNWAFRIRTRLVFPHADNPTPFAHYHNFIRLYNRTATRFRDSLTYDEVLPTDHVVKLKGEILHRSFRTIAHSMRKMLTYSELQVREKGGPRRIHFTRLLLEFPFQFFKFYILRRYCFAGLSGFAYASTIAMARFIRLLIISGH